MNLLKTPSNVSLLKKHNGWFEGNSAVFGSDDDKKRFQSAYAYQQETMRQADHDEAIYGRS